MPRATPSPSSAGRTANRTTSAPYSLDRAIDTTYQPKRRSLGPLTDVDPELNDMGKTAARQVNNKRIRNAVRQLAGKPPRRRKPHHQNHPVTPPWISVGGTNVDDIGTWYQKV